MSFLEHHGSGTSRVSRYSGPRGTSQQGVGAGEGVSPSPEIPPREESRWVSVHGIGTLKSWNTQQRPRAGSVASISFAPGLPCNRSEMHVLPGTHLYGQF